LASAALAALNEAVTNTSTKTRRLTKNILGEQDDDDAGGNSRREREQCGE
jgi:hypothetical protein